MKFSKFKHCGVNQEGIVKEGGAVETTGCIRAGCGCDLKNCKCSEGFWFTIVMPRTKNGVVEGMKVKLTKEEFKRFRDSINK